MIKSQNERVKQVANSEPIKVDFLGLIYSLYKSNGFRLADSVKQLKDKHDGLVHGDYLFAWREVDEKNLSVFAYN